MDAGASNADSPAGQADHIRPDLAQLLGRCAFLRKNSARLAGELDNLTRQIEQRLNELEERQERPEDYLARQKRAD